MAYAYTEDDLETLKKALASGVRSVSINGQTMTYATLAELRSAIAAVERELGLSASTNAKRVTYVRFSRD